MTLRLVILESPYAGNVTANVAYARKALADSLARGEAPIASHLLYTQPGVLNDTNPVERALGMAAGLAWSAVAVGAVFYVNFGWSRGMKAARAHYGAIGLPIEERRLDLGMTADEARRAEAGREDWRADSWQDHCGNPDCEQCTGDIPS